MSKLKIETAIAHARELGIEMNKTTLASKIWAESTQATQRMNISNLISGRTDRVKIEWIDIICAECRVTPNFLLGYE